MKEYTKKKHKEIMDATLKMWEQTMDLLCLSGYEYSIFSPADNGYEAQETSGFEVAVHHPYRNIDIFIGKDTYYNWDKKEKKDILESLIHEGVHVVLWDLSRAGGSREFISSKFNDIVENTTDHLAIIISMILNKKKV